MRAADVMTTGVVTVSPDANIRDVAGVMLERRISAVPVVDAAGKLAGIISEGDLIHRHEADTERKGHWWHALTETVHDAARVYTRAHGRRARDVMTADVVTVTEDTALADVAALLDKHRIKRVPVVKGDKLVGVVSRSNLLQALLAAAPEDDTAAGISVDDTAIRAAIMNEIAANDLSETEINVVVSDGVASLWGAVESDMQRRAINVAAENAKGVKAVEDHLGLLPSNRWRGV